MAVDSTSHSAADHNFFEWMAEGEDEGEEEEEEEEEKSESDAEIEEEHDTLLFSCVFCMEIFEEKAKMEEHIDICMHA